MIVQVHQPLWGGFPMHWAAGSARSYKLVSEKSKAAQYSKQDAKKIKASLQQKYPNAVVQTR